MKDYQEMDVQELARLVAAQTAISKKLNADLDEARAILEDKMADGKTIKVEATIPLPDGFDVSIGTITRKKAKGGPVIVNKTEFLECAIGIGTHLAHYETVATKGWEDYLIYADGQFVDKLTGCPVEGVEWANDAYDGIMVKADMKQLAMAAHALGTTPLALAEGRNDA